MEPEQTNDGPAPPPKMYYSASQRGFFREGMHKLLPDDRVQITQEEWQALLVEQSTGKEIHPDEAGRPIAKEVSTDEKARRLRRARNAALADTDGLVARHRDEIENDPHATTLSADTYRALQSWRAALRALPAAPGFPDIPLPPRPEGV